MVVGAVAGAYLGNPFIGFAIGSMIGQALFPADLPGVQGPRITDDKITTSTVGAPIPLIFGTTVTAGNIIWTGPLVEIATTEEVGGKGGPTQEVTNYTYTRSYAIGLCEGEVSQIIRAWRNEKLVYDARPQQDGETDAAYDERVAASQGFAEGFTFYTGSEAQVADPTMEAVEGVGNVPAYRGLAYIVFTDEEVTDTNGRPANWRFEVSAVTNDESVTITDLQPAAFYPWSTSPDDPRACENDHEYLYVPVYGSPAGTWGTLEDALSEASIDHDRTIIEQLIGWDTDIFATSQWDISPYNAITIGEHIAPFLHYSSEPIDVVDLFLGVLDSADFSAGLSTALASEGIEIGDYFWWSGHITADLNQSGIHVILTDGEEPTYPGFWVKPYNGFGDFDGCDIWRLEDVRISVRRKVRQPDNPCELRCEDAYPALPDNPDYCVIGSTLERDLGYSVAVGSYKALANYGTSGVNVNSYPLGPVIVSGSADDTQAFWDAAYAAAVSDGAVIPGGLTFGAGYPVVPTTTYTRAYDKEAFDPVPPTVGSIVQALCERTGLAADRIDVSDLTEEVPGFRIAVITTARQAIQPLQAYTFFDVVESECLIRFPARGGAIVASLGEDDLGAYNPGGDEKPVLITMERQQDVEMPRLLRVHYEAEAKNYEPGMQQVERLTTDAENKEDVELAIAMTDDKAATIADVLMQDRWWGRESYKGSMSPRWLALEPGDCIEIPVEGQTERARIVAVDMPMPSGPLTVEMVRDDDGSYVSHVVGAASLPSTDSVALEGPTEMVLIDGPALDSSANDAGIYVAVRGVFSGWRGAALYRSLDGGANYERELVINSAATMGLTTDALADGPTLVWDDASTLTVDMDTGELETRTDDAVLSGANAAFVGAADRWEVLQYVNATFVGTFSGKRRYTLSRFLRGRRGTEWATGLHEVGDRFVFIGAGLARLPLELSAVNQERLVKAVTLGTQVQATSAVEFTPEGVALKPYSVVNVSVDNTNGNVRSGLSFSGFTAQVVFMQGFRQKWFSYITESGNPYNEFYDSEDGKDWNLRNRKTSGYPPDTTYEKWTYANGFHVFIGKSTSTTEDDETAPWDVDFWTEGFASTFIYETGITARPVGVFTLDDTIHLLDAEGNFYTTTDGTSWTQIPYVSGLTGMSSRGYVIDAQSRVHIKKFGAYYYMMVGVQRAGDGEATGTNKLVRSTDLATWSDVTLPVGGTLKLYGFDASSEALFINGCNNVIFFTCRSTDGSTFSLVDSGPATEAALDTCSVACAGTTIYTSFKLNTVNESHISTDSGVTWEYLGTSTSTYSNGAMAVLESGSQWREDSASGVAAYIDSDGDGSVGLTWQRRSRYNQELPSGTDVPLNEETEKYEVVYGEESSYVTTPAFSLTAQMQASAGINLQTTDAEIEIYQISASVGRGYVTEVTI
jgi:hypothetical protein